MQESSYDQFVRKHRGAKRDLHQEEVILGVALEIDRVMRVTRTSRPVLSNRLNGARVGLLLDGRNLTLRQLADVAFALGRRVTIRFQPQRKQPKRRR